jgi:serine phosphatase RsbU (regulator of sigma subunit)
MSRPPVRVLLVEDNPGDAVLIREMLRERPTARFALTVVDRLRDAREALADPGFDVVLLDLSLPDSSGLETFHGLRGAGPPRPMVVLTGLDDEALAVRAVQEGAQDYLVKDQVTGRQLIHALSYAVGRHRRQRQIEEAWQATEDELRVASKIHQALLPGTHPAPPGLDVFGASHSAGAVGGDLFGYLTLADGSLGLAVADVTGHGIGPALLMAAVRSYLRALAQAHADSGQILTRANRLFAEDVADGNNCTLLLARLGGPGRSLAHANAGHPPGFLLGADGALKARLYSTGLPLGVLPDAEYPAEATGPLAPGDVLVLVTDGVIDARSPAGEWFGAERVVEVIREYRQEESRPTVEALFAAVREFRGDRPPDDDATAVVVKVTG